VELADPCFCDLIYLAPLVQISAAVEEMQEASRAMISALGNFSGAREVLQTHYFPPTVY
jgi:hypothetical protein